MNLIALTAFGLEAVVARELKSLGYEEQQVMDGRVQFTGDASAVCRANLWLRSAERILLCLGEFDARDFGELFDHTREVAWEEWLPRDAEFPVSAKSVRSQLHNPPAVQRIVKKAIVERLKSVHRRDWFEENGPLYAIEVSILKDRVTLAVDTTGPGLHKRGYRTLRAAAPLKETLAAALIQLSYWNAERPLIDPFCGSGTIPIEAALIGRNIAPGLHRQFPAESWPQIEAAKWTDARTEARDRRREAGLAPIIGTDLDAHALSKARLHAKQAGVEGDIHFQQKGLDEFQTSREYGCLICNPPYGERLQDKEQAEQLYRQMGQTFAPLQSWSLYVLAADRQFERHYGRPADRRRKLYNGRIECTYYQFQGPRPPGKQK